MTVAEDVKAIDLPFDEAIDFFRQKTNVYTHRWNDLWKEAHSRGFMVAGAATDGLLQDFRDAVDKAIARGTSLQEFRADFDGIVKKHGWEYHGTPGWRSRVIYETNLAGAYSAGRYRQMADPDVTAMYPYWQYVHSGSQHPRLQHLAWDGLTLRCDDGFWDTHYPPNGWHCGCRVRPVSGHGLAALGKDGPDDAPPVQMRTWVDKKTGDAHQVPVGIDPGFDYNPGKAWAKAPVRSSPEKELPGPGTPKHPDAGTPLPAVPPQMAEFLGQQSPEGEIVAGQLAPQARHALGSKTADVLMNASFVTKQRGKRGKLPTMTYGLIPELLGNPTVILDQGDRRVLLLLRSGEIWSAAVKTTHDRAQNYLLNFRQSNMKDVQRLLRRDLLIYGDADDLDQ